MSEGIVTMVSDAATYDNQLALNNFLKEAGDELTLSFRNYLQTCVDMRTLGEETPQWIDVVKEDVSTPHLASLIANGEKDIAIHNAAVKINDNLTACLNILAKDVAKEAQQQSEIISKKDVDLIIDTYAKAAMVYVNKEIAASRSSIAVEEMSAAMQYGNTFTLEPATETGKLMKACFDKATNDAYAAIQAGENFSVEDFGKLENGAPSVVQMDANDCPAAFYTVNTLRMIADKEKAGLIDANTAAALVNYASSMAVAITESASQSTEIAKANMLQEAANAKFMLGLHVSRKEMDVKTAQEIMDFHLDSYVQVIANPKNVSINEVAYTAYKDKYVQKELSSNVATKLNGNPYMEGQNVPLLPPPRETTDAEKENPAKTAEKSNKNKSGRDDR